MGDAYELAVRSVHELLVNCDNSPVTKKDRCYVITQLERIFFKDKTIPLEFRAISDSYIAKGSALLSH
jgi:hypothetical protein